jgi:uncharacterized protein YqhQ
MVFEMMISALKSRMGSFWKHLARLALAPALQGSEEVLVGGQAVIEGVMMRSPHSYAVAVRQPAGNIAVMQSFIQRPSEKSRWFKYPVLRGLGTLGQSLVIGIKALRYSADAALEEPAKDGARPEKKQEFSNWLVAFNLLFSLGFFIVFYKLLPLYLTTEAKGYFPKIENPFLFNLVDGVIRIALFLGFLWLISQWKDIQRVFEYHGAEHKVVWAYEKTGRLDLEAARTATRFHPRCGTSFLLVVMVIAILLYMLLPFESFAGRLAGRLALLPLIAGVSYEFIRYAAKSQGVLWRWAAQPGLWLQRITTREPNDAQIETALKALETAMEMEKSRGGELVIA